VPRTVTNASQSVTVRASQAEDARTLFTNMVYSAASNSYDLPTRSLRIQYFRNEHSRLIFSLDWFLSSLPNLSPDDRIWIKQWTTPLLGSIEKNYGDFRHGYDTNTSDEKARAVYAEAIDLTNSQRNFLNGLLEKIAKSFQ
jgi:hypothetical protein